MFEKSDIFKKSAEREHVICNSSANESFQTVLSRAFNRRSFLKGGSALAAATLGTSLLGDSLIRKTGVAQAAAGPKLSFASVAKSVADTVIVPEGYTAKVLLATGDPLRSNVTPYKNDGTDNDFDLRAGDHHDAMQYFGLSQSGTWEQF